MHIIIDILLVVFILYGIIQIKKIYYGFDGIVYNLIKNINHINKQNKESLKEVYLLCDKMGKQISQLSTIDMIFEQLYKQHSIYEKNNIELLNNVNKYEKLIGSFKTTLVELNTKIKSLK